MRKFRIILYVFLCTCVIFNSHAKLDYVCDNHRYISKCGTYTVGTYWLKGFFGGTNFYDYSEEANNLINLRHFLKGEAFYYTDINDEYKYANSNAVTIARDNILNNLCTPENVTCTECPNGGKLPGRSKHTDKWEQFYSFASCFIDVFSDSTGTYQYVDDYEIPQSCYYNMNITGFNINTLSQNDIITGETGGDTGSNF